MFEGKNLHYSPVDNKPLCSYSVKVCKQRRLNGYAFCLRHVLEDPTSPFKQCIHIGKNKHQCNNPVPKNKDTEYCNSHLSMLNNAAQRANQQAATTKSKIKDNRCNATCTSVDSAALADIKMSLQDRLKSKFNLHHRRESKMRSFEEDPYAFPDGDPEPMKKSSSPQPKASPSSSDSVNETVTAIVQNCLNNHNINSVTCCVSTDTITTVTNTGVESAEICDNSTKFTNIASTPIAKLYPELAEKLHLPIAVDNRNLGAAVTGQRLDPSSAGKKPPGANKPRSTTTKSSRTMNKLQSKIAQNKIKDKLKRSQSQSSASNSNQSSPDRKPSTPQSANYPVTPSLSPVTLNSALANINSALASITSTSKRQLLSKHTGASSQPFTTAHTCTPATTVTSSHMSSQQGFMGVSQLPPLNQALWTLQQQQQHGIIPALTSTASLPSPNVPLLSIASSHASPFRNLAALSNAMANMGPSSTNVPPVSSALPLLQPQQQQLDLSAHLQTKTIPFVANVSPNVQDPKDLIPTQSPLPYPPSVALPSQPTTVPTPSLSSPFPSTLPPPPPYPGSPPKILEGSMPQTVTPPAVVQPTKQPQDAPKPAAKSKLKKGKKGKAASATATASSAPVASTSSIAKSSTVIPEPTPDAPPAKICVKVQKPNGLMTEKEARQKLKRHSAVRVYAYHANKKTNMKHILPTGVDSSDSEGGDDMVPWQQHWLSVSSDEEDEDSDMDDDLTLSTMRITQQALLRAKMRRQYMQMRRIMKVNSSCEKYQQRALVALVDACRKSETVTAKAVRYIHRKRSAEKEEWDKTLSKRQCLYKEDEGDDVCNQDALPYTNHCVKHIMYNVDQQMFDYCTAKFSDNTQCCVPVFDIKHELPLCTEHGQKADNYQKSQEQCKSQLKKPRKKTKPSALTRPPKKGKKKKNVKKNAKNAKCDDINSQSDAMETENDEDKTDDLLANHLEPGVKIEHEEELKPSVEEDIVNGLKVDEVMKEEEMEDLGKELEESFSPGTIDKSLDHFPLDMDEAAKLLDKHDINDVLNKLPEDTFDLFNVKNDNGQYSPTKEESDMIDRALADVAQGVAFPGAPKAKLEQQSTEPVIDDDELTKQIADSLLNQNALSPTASIGEDDLNQDNLNELASSLTPHDLKSISQVLSFDNTGNPASSMLMGLESSLVVNNDSTGANGVSTATSVNISVRENFNQFSSQSVSSSSPLEEYMGQSGLNLLGKAAQATSTITTTAVTSPVVNLSAFRSGYLDNGNLAQAPPGGPPNVNALSLAQFNIPVQQIGSGAAGNNLQFMPALNSQGSFGSASTSTRVTPQQVPGQLQRQLSAPSSLAAVLGHSNHQTTSTTSTPVLSAALSHSQSNSQSAASQTAASISQLAAILAGGSSAVSSTPAASSSSTISHLPAQLPQAPPAPTPAPSTSSAIASLPPNQLAPLLSSQLQQPTPSRSHKATVTPNSAVLGETTASITAIATALASQTPQPTATQTNLQIGALAQALASHNLAPNLTQTITASALVNHGRQEAVTLHQPQIQTQLPMRQNTVSAAPPTNLNSLAAILSMQTVSSTTQPNQMSHLAAALTAQPQQLQQQQQHQQQQTSISLNPTIAQSTSPSGSQLAAVLAAPVRTPVTPVTPVQPQIQQQQQQNAAANAQISAIAAALANNHPVPPINPGTTTQQQQSQQQISTQIVTSIATPGGTLPNGLPTITAFPTQQVQALSGGTEGPGVAGVKLAYPIQTLLPGGILSSQPLQGQNVTIATPFPTQQLQFAIATAVSQQPVSVANNTYNSNTFSKS